MSALGQKRTNRPHVAEPGMSALPPKADIVRVIPAAALSECRHRGLARRDAIPRLIVPAPDSYTVVAGVRREGQIRSTNAAGEIARGHPVVQPERIDRHILHAEVAGLEVNEQRARRIERAKQARLADAGRANDQSLHATRLCEPLICADDLHRALPLMMSRAAPSAVAGLPSALRSSARRSVSGEQPNCSARLATTPRSRTHALRWLPAL